MECHRRNKMLDTSLSSFGSERFNACWMPNVLQLVGVETLPQDVNIFLHFSVQSQAKSLTHRKVISSPVVVQDARNTQQRSMWLQTANSGSFWWLWRLQTGESRDLTTPTITVHCSVRPSPEFCLKIRSSKECHVLFPTGHISKTLTNHAGSTVKQ